MWIGRGREEMRRKFSTSFAIEPAVAAQLDDEAHRQRISRSELLRRIVTWYLTGAAPRETTVQGRIADNRTRS